MVVKGEFDVRQEEIEELRTSKPRKAPKIRTSKVADVHLTLADTYEFTRCGCYGAVPAENEAED